MVTVARERIPVAPAPSRQPTHDHRSVVLTPQGRRCLALYRLPLLELAQLAGIPQAAGLDPERWQHQAVALVLGREFPEAPSC